MVLMAGSLHLLIQFINSQGSCFFVSNFLNFGVKERSLCRFDFAVENFPIFQIFCHSIIVQCTSALFVLPTLGMLCDVDSFRIYFPYVFNF